MSGDSFDGVLGTWQAAVGKATARTAEKEDKRASNWTLACELLRLERYEEQPERKAA